VLTVLILFGLASASGRRRPCYSSTPVGDDDAAVWITHG